MRHARAVAFGLILLAPVAAEAQPYTRVTSCSAISDVQASSGGYIDVNGKICTSATLTGSVSVGNVSIDQSVPGTTNGVVVNSGSVTASGSVANSNEVAAGTSTTGVVGPMVQGAVNTGALPAPTNATTLPLQLDASGRLIAVLRQGNNSATVGSAADASTLNTVLYTYSAMGLYNGTNTDRGFTCPNTAAISVTAGNTTQIVALSGSTIIRVCSIAVSMSAAGTAQFVYGTGSNCGTGTTNITGAMTLATGTPMTLAAPAGSSVMRGAAANALCVAAVTGNVTGWLSYAQY